MSYAQFKGRKTQSREYDSHIVAEHGVEIHYTVKALIKAPLKK